MKLARKHDVGACKNHAKCMFHWPKRRERMFHVRCAQRPLAGVVIRRGKEARSTGYTWTKGSHAEGLSLRRGSCGSHSALRVGPVDTLCLVCMRNKRNTRMHKDGSHGPLLQLHSRQLALHQEEEQIEVPSVFSDVIPRPLTRICRVAWTPEECPQRACPQCSQSGFRQHDFRRKHLTPR